MAEFVGGIYNFLYGTSLLKYVLEDVKVYHFIQNRSARLITRFMCSVIEYKYRPGNSGFLEAKASFMRAAKSF
jgi:hypothetical protein